MLLNTCIVGFLYVKSKGGNHNQMSPVNLAKTLLSRDLICSLQPFANPRLLAHGGFPNFAVVVFTTHWRLLPDHLVPIFRRKPKTFVLGPDFKRRWVRCNAGSDVRATYHPINPKLFVGVIFMKEFNHLQMQRLIQGGLVDVNLSGLTDEAKHFIRV
jgi:hypothetical protein